MYLGVEAAGQPSISQHPSLTLLEEIITCATSCSPRRWKAPLAFLCWQVAFWSVNPHQKGPLRIQTHTCIERVWEGQPSCMLGRSVSGAIIVPSLNKQIIIIAISTECLLSASNIFLLNHINSMKYIFIRPIFCRYTDTEVSEIF